MKRFIPRRAGAYAIPAAAVLCLCLCLSLVGCAGWGVDSDGRYWDIRSGEAVEVGPISARRDVTISATGTIDQGTVTLVALLDGGERGDPVVLGAGTVDSAVRFEYEPGLWSFTAEASADASGNLYLSISDR